MQGLHSGEGIAAISVKAILLEPVKEDGATYFSRNAEAAGPILGKEAHNRTMPGRGEMEVPSGEYGRDAKG